MTNDHIDFSWSFIKKKLRKSLNENLLIDKLMQCLTSNAYKNIIWLSGKFFYVKCRKT